MRWNKYQFRWSKLASLCLAAVRNCTPRSTSSARRQLFTELLPLSFYHSAFVDCHFNVLSHSPVSHSHFLLCLHCSLTLLMHSMFTETWSYKIGLFWEEPFVYFRLKNTSQQTNQPRKQTPKNLTKTPQRPIYLNYITLGFPNPREYNFLLSKRQRVTHLQRHPDHSVMVLDYTGEKSGEQTQISPSSVPPATPCRHTEPPELAVTSQWK